MIGSSQEIIGWLYNQDVEKTFKIEEYKEKRSLNANAYCWTLIGKIARELVTTKEIVYRDFIKHCGIYRVIRIDNKAVDTFKKLWEEKGLGYIAEIGSKDEEYTEILAYYGSSSYNTKQMSQFIDYIVQEAKQLGIETLPPNKIEELKRMWNNA